MEKLQKGDYVVLDCIRSNHPIKGIYCIEDIDDSKSETLLDIYTKTLHRPHENKYVEEIIHYIIPEKYVIKCYPCGTEVTICYNGLIEDQKIFNDKRAIIKSCAYKYGIGVMYTLDIDNGKFLWTDESLMTDEEVEEEIRKQLVAYFEKTLSTPTKDKDR